MYIRFIQLDVLFPSLLAGFSAPGVFLIFEHLVQVTNKFSLLYCITALLSFAESNSGPLQNRLYGIHVLILYFPNKIIVSYCLGFCKNAANILRTIAHVFLKFLKQKMFFFNPALWVN